MFQSAKERLLKAYNAQEDSNYILELEKKREQFLSDFAPEKLKDLKGQELLYFFHGAEKRQGLFYQLEFGSVCEGFGSVAGGSALKFKVYRGEDGEWRLKGKSNFSVLCSEAEATAMTQKLAGQLNFALDLAGQLDLEDGTLRNWEEFETAIEEQNALAPVDETGESAPIATLGWGHKYLAIVHPQLVTTQVVS